MRGLKKAKIMSIEDVNLARRRKSCGNFFYLRALPKAKILKIVKRVDGNMRD